MQRKQAQLFQASEFAAMAGVTVRTLHYYDELGLLTPAMHTESGYRLYAQNDLARLQQISALRFIGFPLKDIKGLIDNSELSLRSALRLQREIILKKREQLDAAVRAIEQAESAWDGEPAERLRALRNIMEMMNMEQDWSWVKNHYTGEQLKRLEQRDDPSMHEEWQKQWAALIAEVEAARHDDPASDTSQALAARWRELISRFTNNEPDIEASLRNVYADRASQPSGFKRPWSDEADDFISNAIAKSKRSY